MDSKIVLHNPHIVERFCGIGCQASQSGPQTDFCKEFKVGDKSWSKNSNKILLLSYSESYKHGAELAEERPNETLSLVSWFYLYDL